MHNVSGRCMGMGMGMGGNGNVKIHFRTSLAYRFSIHGHVS